MNCEYRLESVVPVRPPHLFSATSHLNISSSTANHLLFIEVTDECAAIVLTVSYTGAISQSIESVSLRTANNFFDVPSVGGSTVVIQADITEYVALMKLLYPLTMDSIIIVMAKLSIVMDSPSMVSLVGILEALRIVECLSHDVTSVRIAGYVSIYQYSAYHFVGVAREAVALF